MKKEHLLKKLVKNKLINKIRYYFRKRFRKRDDNTKLILGKLLSFQQQGIKATSLSDIGFSVFSQWDEDGMIQYLVKKLPIQNKFFVEFGVEDYNQSNTRFLMMNNNWSGLIIDAGQQHIADIKDAYYYWLYDLTAIQAFITKNNINDFIKRHLDKLNIGKDIGLLSIDIDGVDYWVLKEIECARPDIIICEYRSLRGAEIPLTIPYSRDFERTKYHYSELYYGANLKAFETLLKGRSYVYVGSSIGHINAFFVKRELAESYVPELIKDVDEEFHLTKVRESKDESGEFNFKRGRREQLREIENMELMNLSNNEILKIGEIFEIDA
jgi:hypothetical protein